MKTAVTYSVRLLLFTLLIVASGYLLINLTALDLNLREIATLTICFSFISFISLLIFFRGRKREPDSQTMHLFVATGIKLLLEMVLALIWFFVAKKTEVTSLILFFVLYLAFSLFSIFYMLNTLKNKSL